MDALLIEEVARSVSAGAGPRCSHLLSRIVTLFLTQAERLAEDHVGVFDGVMIQLLPAVDVAARANEADRLAPLPNAPLGTIRILANDVIPVARPILVRSPRLGDDDLITVSRLRSGEHRLAICERRALSLPLTDALLEASEAAVLRALAGNPEANLSLATVFRLVISGREDDELGRAAMARPDLPKAALLALSPSAKGFEWLADEKGPTAGSAIPCNLRLGGLDETALGYFARQRSYADVVLALALLSHVDVRIVERLFAESRLDAVLTMARAVNLSWSVVRAVLRLVPLPAGRTIDMGLLEIEYLKLTSVMANRFLRFMNARGVG